MILILFLYQPHRICMSNSLKCWFKHPLPYLIMVVDRSLKEGDAVGTC